MGDRGWNRQRGRHQERGRERALRLHPKPFDEEGCVQHPSGIGEEPGEEADAKPDHDETSALRPWCPPLRRRLSRLPVHEDADAEAGDKDGGHEHQGMAADERAHERADNRGRDSHGARDRKDRPVDEAASSISERGGERGGQRRRQRRRECEEAGGVEENTQRRRGDRAPSFTEQAGDEPDDGAESGRCSKVGEGFGLHGPSKLVGGAFPRQVRR